jgi:hypothetical protein
MRRRRRRRRRRRERESGRRSRMRRIGLVVEVVGFSSEGSIGLVGGVNGRYQTCRLSGETTAVPRV